MRSTALVVASLVGGSYAFQPQCALQGLGVGRGAWAPPPSYSASSTARSVMSMGATGEELGAMSYRELQAECKLRGLPSSGKKDVLLERLNENAADVGAAPDADAAAAPTQDQVLAAAMASDISATAAAGAAGSGASISGEAPSLDDLLNMGVDLGLDLDLDLDLDAAPADAGAGAGAGASLADGDDDAILAAAAAADDDSFWAGLSDVLSPEGGNDDMVAKATGAPVRGGGRDTSIGAGGAEARGVDDMDFSWLDLPQEDSGLDPLVESDDEGGLGLGLGGGGGGGAAGSAEGVGSKLFAIFEEEIGGDEILPGREGAFSEATPEDVAAALADLAENVQVSTWLQSSTARRWSSISVEPTPPHLALPYLASPHVTSPRPNPSPSHSAGGTTTYSARTRHGGTWRRLVRSWKATRRSTPTCFARARRASSERRPKLCSRIWSR